MRTLSRRIFAFVLPLFAGAALLGCEEGPTNVESDRDAAASVHGAAILTATADIDAVDTKAADMNSFKPGDDVGTIDIIDDRAKQELTVEGEASGLDPAGAHVSLFYDVESTVTGPEACEPALGFDGEFDQDKVLSLLQMEIGPPDNTPPLRFWTVEEDGDATLEKFVMTRSDKKYIKVERIGTVSIRDARVNDGIGPNAVVGCGEVIQD